MNQSIEQLKTYKRDHKRNIKLIPEPVPSFINKVYITSSQPNIGWMSPNHAPFHSVVPHGMTNSQPNGQAPVSSRNPNPGLALQRSGIWEPTWGSGHDSRGGATARREARTTPPAAVPSWSPSCGWPSTSVQTTARGVFPWRLWRSGVASSWHMSHS